MRATIILGLVLMVTGPSFGEAPSSPTESLRHGNGLLQACKTDLRGAADVTEALRRQEDWFECAGYVDGVIDAFTEGLNSGIVPLTSERDLFCVPGGVTAGQAKDVVIKFLQDHPEKRHEASVLLITAALHQAWPCSAK